MIDTLSILITCFLVLYVIVKAVRLDTAERRAKANITPAARNGGGGKIGPP